MFKSEKNLKFNNKKSSNSIDFSNFNLKFKWILKFLYNSKFWFFIILMQDPALED